MIRPYKNQKRMVEHTRKPLTTKQNILNVWAWIRPLNLAPSSTAAYHLSYDSGCSWLNRWTQAQICWFSVTLL